MIISAKEAIALNNAHKEYNNTLNEIEMLIQEACNVNQIFIYYDITNSFNRPKVLDKLKDLGYHVDSETNTLIRISWEEGL